MPLHTSSAETDEPSEVLILANRSMNLPTLENRILALRDNPVAEMKEAIE